MSASDVLRRVISALNQAGISYMLSGSFASAFYGSKRSTVDIDIVIDVMPEQMGSFLQALPPEQYYVDLDAALQALRQQSMFNLIDQKSSWKIDFIIRKSRPFSLKEFSRRQQVKFDDIAVYITSPEDVVLSKLEWAKMGQSQRQIEDVAAILELRWKSLDQEYIREWMTELGLEKEWDDARVLAGIKESNQ